MNLNKLLVFKIANWKLYKGYKKKRTLYFLTGLLEEKKYLHHHELE